MPTPKVSYTELTYQVVRQSPEPLTFSEIMQRVNDLTPITTKNPKQTIRGAIGQGCTIVATGDGRYGWRPRLMTGVHLRLTLSADDLARSSLEFGDDIREALWPTFFESAMRSDRDPITVDLPNGQSVAWSLSVLPQKEWGTTGTPEFWDWLAGQNAAPGDHLLIRVVDGMAKHNRLEFQPRAARDEAAVTARNQAIVAAALAFVGKRHQYADDWGIIRHLLCTGHYHHPLPPDPLAEIWRPEMWQDKFEAEEIRPRGGWFFTGEKTPPPPPTDTGLSALFGAPVQVYNYENPPDLPREYDPNRGERRPRPSPLGQKGPVKTFTFRVSHRAWPKIWREIEIAADQTLEDLHLIIQEAYDWADDHLYSFFMSGRAWDQSSEIGCPWSDSSRHTHQAQIEQLGLQVKQTFLYLFDYGDGHEFKVQLLKVNPAAPKDPYPKIVARRGQSPPQYPAYDE